MKRTSEAAFETASEDVLLAQGYEKLDSKFFDREQAIFPEVVLDFIRTTQVKTWEKLEALHGDKTGERVLEALCKWMDREGSLAILRHGFKCFGKTLRVAFFRPAHGLNPELEKRYRANRLGLTRQLHFSPKSEQSLDVALSVNGVPVVTLELKNSLSGQTVANAVHQYRNDRDPREKIFEFKKRSLVHFAVDTEEVHMATRLAGSSTFFLPFNRGRDGGAGNAPDPQGRNYRTAYLWEEVLQYDSLLDLLARFLHLQVDDKIDWIDFGQPKAGPKGGPQGGGPQKMSDDGKKVRKETMIFPRYHQLQAVRQLVSEATVEGVGHNYLVEHSAGSGKSNTIAWLAHRLSSLHNVDDERVFDSVVVITDRVVLDRQLQNTIYQFDHRQGVVQKIDEDSRQLAEALESGVPIIITTLQKFPFVSGQLMKLAEDRGEGARSHLPTRKYAVIIDEAHSSQSGETATELKGVLGGLGLLEKAREMAADEAEMSGYAALTRPTKAREAAQDECEVELERLFRSMAKRGRQPNMSFFAFTATPKHKTLAIFGRNGEPSHRYTMRQAIEEEFILDVLANYVSYKTYYRLIKGELDESGIYLQQEVDSFAAIFFAPKRKSGPGYQFDEEVDLDYYRLQKISEGSISLGEGTAKPLDGPREVGTGMVRDEDVPLSSLINIINDRFGSELTEADQLFFDQLAEAAVLDDALRRAAEANPADKFQLVFRQALESLFIERMDLNEELFTNYMSNPEMQDVVSKWLGDQVYKRFSSSTAKADKESQM